MCTRPALRAPPLRLPALRALPPLMLMMRPQPAVFMNGMTAREQRSAPTYLTLKSSIKSSSTTLSIGPVAVVAPPVWDPLLTRMCSPPSCSAASATTRSTCSLLVTAAASGRMRRFVAAASSRAVTSRSPLVRATIATSTPSRANSRAIALPMPRLPPVTIACLPCNPRSMALSLLGGVTAWGRDRDLLLHCSLFSLRKPGARVLPNPGDVRQSPRLRGRGQRDGWIGRPACWLRAVVVGELLAGERAGDALGDFRQHRRVPRLPLGDDSVVDVLMALLKLT